MPFHGLPALAHIYVAARKIVRRSVVGPVRDISYYLMGTLRNQPNKTKMAFIFFNLLEINDCGFLILINVGKNQMPNLNKQITIKCFIHRILSECLVSLPVTQLPAREPEMSNGPVIVVAFERIGF